MAMGCHRHVSWRYDWDWFGVVATAPRITQGRGDEEMTYRRTFREWAAEGSAPVWRCRNRAGDDGRRCFRWNNGRALGV
jgi:hypothetical protein